MGEGVSPPPVLWPLVYTPTQLVLRAASVPVQPRGRLRIERVSPPDSPLDCIPAPATGVIARGHVQSRLPGPRGGAVVNHTEDTVPHSTGTSLALRPSGCTGVEFLYLWGREPYGRDTVARRSLPRPELGSPLEYRRIGKFTEGGSCR